MKTLNNTIKYISIPLIVINSCFMYWIYNSSLPWSEKSEDLFVLSLVLVISIIDICMDLGEKQ